MTTDPVAPLAVRIAKNWIDGDASCMSAEATADQLARAVLAQHEEIERLRLGLVSADAMPNHVLNLALAIADRDRLRAALRRALLWAEHDLPATGTEAEKRIREIEELRKIAEGA